MQISFEGYQVTELPVQWGEMDAALHINNTVFLKYAEAGRIAYFDNLDFQVDTTGKTSPIGPILAEVNCKYKMPLTYPDTVSIATKTLADTIDEFSFWVEQIVVSHKAERIAAEIKCRLVSYDYQKLRKAPLPLELRQKLRQGV